MTGSAPRLKSSTCQRDGIDAAMRARAPSPMLVASLMLVAIASALSLFSPFVVPVAADGVAKLASGTSPGPFAFGGVHTQKG